MAEQTSQRVVIAGTDTGVGKTVLAALMTLLLDADYWKPVQSGMLDETDAEAVARIAALPPERIHPERYRLRQPLSPDQSASIDGVEIDLQQLAVPETTRPLVIECAGGVLVPMNRHELQIDVLERWGIPVLLAARSTLGTLNHTLLSLEALDRREIPVAGIVLIGPEHRLNLGSLHRWTHHPIVGSIPPLETISAETLRDVAATSFAPITTWMNSSATHTSVRR